MRRWLQSVGAWLEARLGIKQAILPIITHPVPHQLTTSAGWWYVFGSATLTLFMIQIATGICLALVYVPSAGEAYETLQYLNFQQPLGWFIRAVHNFAASGMIIMLYVHMAQVFLHGAFKYPREMTWLLGVILLFLTLGMAFTGQVLRWDQDAYWGIGVGAAMLGRVPFIGPALVHLLLGGPIIGADTLSRFFALHVFVIPGLLIGALSVHLYLVVRKGVSEPPVPGKVVDPATYDAEYEKAIHEHGVPFFPEPVWRDVIFSSAVIILVVVLAVVFGPQGPGVPPDPTLIPTNPRPDWYFLPLFALLSLCPPDYETAVILIMPVVVVGVLVAIPFVAGRGERAPSRRPIAVLSVVLIAISYAVLGWLGYASPWSPDMYAWSGTPVPPVLLQARTPLEVMGAAVLQNKDCRNCHALEGQGGHRGPDLTRVGTKLTRDELVRQVLQGGGNMPAYGKQLKPAEVEALVAFLASLRPRNQLPAESPTSNPPEPTRVTTSKAPGSS